MDYEITREGAVAEVGIIYRIQTPLAFDELLETVSPDMVPSIREVALARVSADCLTDSKVRVREGVVYAPQMPPLLMLTPPFLLEPKGATNADREIMPPPVDLTHILQQAELEKQHTFLERKIFPVPQGDIFKLLRGNILNILPQVMRERFRRIGACQETLEDIILESGRYLRDQAWLEQQEPITQFAVCLFKEAVIPYALFSPRDICVKCYSTEEVATIGCAFMQPIIFDAVRHCSCVDARFNRLSQRLVSFYISR